MFKVGFLFDPGIKGSVNPFFLVYGANYGQQMVHKGLGWLLIERV